MESKECKICDKEKSLTDFYYRKDSGKYRAECKECFNERGKKQGKEWRKKNVERVKEYHKRYYIENKEEINKKNKKWQKDNKEKINKNKREWRKNNPEKAKQHYKKWKEKNGEYLRSPELKERERIRSRKRREDPIYRLNQNLSRSMNSSLKSRNLSKNGRDWEKIVGYTIYELRKHLEEHFLPGMSWKNYGRKGWHIDHIIPKDFFKFTSTDDVEFKYCWSLANLQPLWEPDNLRKSNKLPKEIN